MAWTNNNNAERKDTNTRSQTYRNSKSTICDNSAIVVSYWEDMVKIAFTAELPSQLQTESRRWDYDSQVITCIPREKCNELVNGYKNIIIPAIEKKTDTSIGIIVGGVNMIVVGTGVKLGKGEPAPYIALHKNINPNTRLAENSVVYQFNTGEIITGYNAETGEAESSITTNNELDVFMKDLDSFRSASSKAFVHSARCVDKTYKDIITNDLIAIGKKVGVDLSFTGNSNGNRGSSFSGAMFTNKPASSEVSTDVVTDLDDIPF